MATVHLAYSDLTVLPVLPDTVEVLVADHNVLTELPALPPRLRELYCSDNQLTGLPNLPDTLTFLDCESNAIHVLPKLPLSLRFLNCIDNQLTTLPKLPPMLETLECAENPFYPALARIFAQHEGDMAQLIASVRHEQEEQERRDQVKQRFHNLGMLRAVGKYNGFGNMPRNITSRFGETITGTLRPTLKNTMTHLRNVEYGSYGPRPLPKRRGNRKSRKGRKSNTNKTRKTNSRK